MKRWGTLALVMIVATATGAAARHRGAGRSSFGGAHFRSHRHSGVDLRLGFGSRFGRTNFHASYSSFPFYGYGAFPGYAAFPAFGFGFPGFGYGYGYPFPFLSYSPTQAYLPFWNNAVGVPPYSLPWGSNVNAGSSEIELPPRVVVIGGDSSYAPRLSDGSARLERGGERYYLDPRGRTPVREQASTLKDTFRDKLRLEVADTDQYLVRWAGDPSEIVALELTALDADRKVVMRRLIKAAPFRGLLNTGGKTITVTLSIDVKDGPTVTLEYPLERFQALAD